MLSSRDIVGIACRIRRRRCSGRRSWCRSRRGKRKTGTCSRWGGSGSGGTERRSSNSATTWCAKVKGEWRCRARLCGRSRSGTSLVLLRLAENGKGVTKIVAIDIGETHLRILVQHTLHGLSIGLVELARQFRQLCRSKCLAGWLVGIQSGKGVTRKRGRCGSAGGWRQVDISEWISTWSGRPLCRCCRRTCCKVSVSTKGNT